MLDYFWFSLSDDDFGAKWEAVAWPQKLAHTMERVVESLADEVQKFLLLHVGDEAAHQEQIEYLTERVVHLQGESNFDKVVSGVGLRGAGALGRPIRLGSEPAVAGRRCSASCRALCAGSGGCSAR